MIRKRLLGAAGLVLVIVGCAAESPADGGSYGSTTELRDAIVKAGWTCAEWDEHNKTETAIGSGTCDDNLVLAIYSSEADREAQVDIYKMLGEYVSMEVLIGRNWTAHADGLDELQKSMGGSIMRTSPDE